MENTSLTYKGLPLVRNDNEFYYGNPDAEFIVWMSVMNTKQVGDRTIADKIHVSLVSTDTSLPPKERVKKMGVKNGLCRALNVGFTWLQSELGK